ncbi:hypothetical protein BLNAU_24127 [Blattamonas nauphoetae]|uniref:Uncharacterized protein n=1 Tax=Blattamonas nauphoetae TaxID=2049346 RepID=A0ABQ9WQC0_9EUKA|nr:hypothetical protein BLNAU_24127 [Blattamonas nauphoetae]
MRVDVMSHPHMCSFSFELQPNSSHLNKSLFVTKTLSVTDNHLDHLHSHLPSNLHGQLRLLAEPLFSVARSASPQLLVRAHNTLPRSDRLDSKRAHQPHLLCLLTPPNTSNCRIRPTSRLPVLPVLFLPLRQLLRLFTQRDHQLRSSIQLLQQFRSFRSHSRCVSISSMLGDKKVTSLQQIRSFARCQATKFSHFIHILSGDTKFGFTLSSNPSLHRFLFLSSSSFSEDRSICEQVVRTIIESEVHGQQTHLFDTTFMSRSFSFVASAPQRHPSQ